MCLPHPETRTANPGFISSTEDKQHCGHSGYHPPRGPVTRSGRCAVTRAGNLC
nr:MAG TPA: hypothetical protein [Caudoviricetes sp.]